MIPEATPTHMRNLSLLVVLAFATIGVWVFSSSILLAPLLRPGVSYRQYFGLVSIPELLDLLLFCVWTFLVARLGHTLFSGPFAGRYRVTAVALAVFFFPCTHGVLILSNFSFEFVTCIIIFTASVAACAWYGLRRGPIL